MVHRQADWFLNLQAHPEARVEVAGARFPARAVFLDRETAEGEFRVYARRHPLAHRLLCRLLLRSGPDCRLMAERVPLVRLIPVREDV